MAFLIVQADGGNHDLALADGGHLPVRIGPGEASLSPARIFTPEGVISDAFSPDAEGSGTLLLVGDITPIVTGVLTVLCTLALSAGASPGNDDDTQFIVRAVPALTAIAGGTAMPDASPAGTIIATPDSTTPADSGAPLVAVGGPTVDTGGLANLIVTFTVTFQATAGERTGIVIRALSSNARTWTIGGTFAVLEAP